MRDGGTGRERELVQLLHLLSIGNMEYVFDIASRSACIEVYHATAEFFRTHNPMCWDDVMSYLMGRFPDMTRDTRASIAMFVTMLYREREDIALLDEGVVELLDGAEAKAMRLIEGCDTEAPLRLAPGVFIAVFDLVIATMSDELLRAAIESAPRERILRLGKRPLVAVAMHFKNLGCVDALVGMGCDANARRHGATAMQIAAEKGLARAIPVLAKHGADADIRSLDIAGRKEDDTLRTMVSCMRDVTTAGRGGRTPLMACIAARDAEAVRLLLERDVDVDRADDLGNTALHVAVERGMCGVVPQLLGLGADANARRRADGNTPLHLAVCLNCGDCMQSLTPFTCVRARNRWWQTPDMMKRLIAPGG